MFLLGRYWISNYWQTLYSLVSVVLAAFLALSVYFHSDIARVLLFCSIALLLLAVLLKLNEKKITESLNKWAKGNDHFLQACIESNTEEAKNLRPAPFIATHIYDHNVGEEFPLFYAVKNSNFNLVSFFIESNLHLGVENAFQRFRLQNIAIHNGDVSVFKKLQDALPVEPKTLEDFGITRFMIDCFLGDYEKVKKQDKRFLAQQFTKEGEGALHFAIYGAADERCVTHLLDLGADINHAETQSRSKILSPLSIAFEKNLPTSILLKMLKTQNDYTDFSYKGNATNPFIIAAQLGMTDVLMALKDKIDIYEKDDEGLDALARSRTGNQLGAEKLIRGWLNEKKTMTNSTENKPTIAQKAAPSKSAFLQERSKTTIVNIEEELRLSLRGMIGIEKFIKNFAHELDSFLQSGAKTKGLVLWGNSDVGKTEIATRVSGESLNTSSSLEISGLKFLYVACCNGALDIKSILDSVEDGTVIFLDEIDKYLSPESGVVSESQAKGLRTAITTNFYRKKVLWVLVGSFLDIRKGSKLSLDILKKYLGTELASRFTDFSDWQLDSWTPETLLKAAQLSTVRFSNVEYDDESLAKLVQHIIGCGWGVRAFENALEAIVRSVRDRTDENGSVVINVSDVQSYIQKSCANES